MLPARRAIYRARIERNDELRIDGIAVLHRDSRVCSTSSASYLYPLESLRATIKKCKSPFLAAFQFRETKVRNETTGIPASRNNSLTSIRISRIDRQTIFQMDEPPREPQMPQTHQTGVCVLIEPIHALRAV